MFRALSATTLLFTNLACHSQKVEPTDLKNPLPLKRLIESPDLEGSRPKNIKISPDGSHLTFLKPNKDDQKTLDLWTFDTKSGQAEPLVESQVLLKGKQEVVSEEERARRERKRIQNNGIVEYQWSKQGNQILFPINGDLFLYQLEKKKVVQITNSKEYEIDPRFSPKGHFVSFIRNYNVFIFDVRTQTEKQVTFAGQEDAPMGVAEFIAQEEMGRYRGYWWSPDESYLAITRVDNRPVAKTERFEIYADSVRLVQQRYPKTGATNASVQIQIFKTQNAGRPQKAMTVPLSGSDHYIPQVKWLPGTDKPKLSYSVQSRDQKKLEFYIFDTTTRKMRLVFTEQDPAWVNIRHDYVFIDDQTLLWVGEDSGFPHIQKINLTSGAKQSITQGLWAVKTLLAYDKKTQQVYFTANKTSSLENQLFSSPLTPGDPPKQISQGEGYHKIMMAKKPKFYLDNHSTPEAPGSLRAHDLTGKPLFDVHQNKIESGHPLAPYQSSFSAWEFGRLKTREGVTLFYKWLKPPSFNNGQSYPVIQYIYGGPGVQLVTKGWSRQNLFHQILAQNGFIVVVADNQGTPNRGREFERRYHLNFGRIEVQDQSALIKQLTEKYSFMDQQRIGVFGHSYGGYLTLMLMSQHPDLYKAGVSGAPVVDWSLYDTHYTERYLGKPQDQETTYQQANVLTHVKQLKGKLLVAHGMADDNVLFSHSLMLYSTLQEAGLLFDTNAYPGAKHGIRQKKSWQHHYQKSILNHFKENL